MVPWGGERGFSTEAEVVAPLSLQVGGRWTRPVGGGGRWDLVGRESVVPSVMTEDGVVCRPVEDDLHALHSVFGESG